MNAPDPGKEGPPFEPDKHVPMKPDEDKDPTKHPAHDPNKNDPTRISEPPKTDPTRIQPPPATPGKPLPDTTTGPRGIFKFNLFF